MKPPIVIVRLYASENPAVRITSRRQKADPKNRIRLIDGQPASAHNFGLRICSGAGRILAFHAAPRCHESIVARSRRRRNRPPPIHAARRYPVRSRMDISRCVGRTCRQCPRRPDRHLVHRRHVPASRVQLAAVTAATPARTRARIAPSPPGLRRRIETRDACCVLERRRPWHHRLARRGTRVPIEHRRVVALRAIGRGYRPAASATDGARCRAGLADGHWITYADRHRGPAIALDRGRPASSRAHAPGSDTPRATARHRAAAARDGCSCDAAAIRDREVRARRGARGCPRPTNAAIAACRAASLCSPGTRARGTRRSAYADRDGARIAHRTARCHAVGIARGRLRLDIPAVSSTPDRLAGRVHALTR